MATARLPRLLHPAAWWLWALCLAVAASRTTNPLLLALLSAVVAQVVMARRPRSPWDRAFVVFVRLGLAALLIRVVLFALVTPAGTGRVLLRVPSVSLPHWLAGLRLGGPVTADTVLASAYSGLQLAVVLLCVGAANSLTSPRRLLRSLPSALYEAGVSLTVAVAFVPQAVAALGRIRAARRLRGRRDRGLRGVLGLGLPVLDGALERSVELAAAMEARGFGRRADGSARARRVTASVTLGGIATMLASSYALLDRAAPRPLGLPLLIAGVVITAAGFGVGARRGGRTRYRPARWRAGECIVVGCGLIAVVAVSSASANALSTGTVPPAAPAAPLLPLAGLLVAALPAWLTPPAPAARRRTSTGQLRAAEPTRHQPATGNARRFEPAHHFEPTQ